MSDRDLRNLYENVCRGDEYIVPKDIELIYNEMTKNDLHKLIDKLPIRNGDDAQIQKLYNRINAFMAYEPVKITLDKKNYNKKIIKKFAQEIQTLVEDLPQDQVDYFIDYINDDDKQSDFLVVPRAGNIFTDLLEYGIPPELITKIFYHTGQDEGKRGVGMGELGLSLLFRNVHSAVGKGDLSIQMGKRFEEFEVKGEGATLGEKPDGFPINFKRFKQFGIERYENVYSFKPVLPDGMGLIEGEGWEDGRFSQPGLNRFAEFLSVVFSTYLNINDARVQKTLKQLDTAMQSGLAEDVKLEKRAVKARWKMIDWNDPVSVHKNISLMNFIRYAIKEEFKSFMAHDFGTLKYKKDGVSISAPSPKNQGEYVFVRGTPEQMAQGLFELGAKFERIKFNNLRPRIGLHPSKV